jgi:hypothetical protein
MSLNPESEKKLGRQIDTFVRPDGAELEVYEHGVVLSGANGDIEVEFGFEGFWGCIAQKAVVESASKAGAASASKLTPEQRSERAKKAVAAREAKRKSEM